MYYFLYHNYDSKNKAILSHNDSNRDVCDNCGAIHVTYKGVFNFKIMGELLDYYMVSGTPVISERFLNVLQENGFNGYEVNETAPSYGTATMVGDPIKEKYYLLKVTGRCGLVCDMNGEPLPHCRKCKFKFPFSGFISDGVLFNQDLYDGSDIFVFENMSNIPIVSDEIKNVITNNKLTNLRFVPLSDYIYKGKMDKETAINWINEGETCDELLEAWLKYGVITEDMIPKK